MTRALLGPNPLRLVVLAGLIAAALTVFGLTRPRRVTTSACQCRCAAVQHNVVGGRTTLEHRTPPGWQLVSLHASIDGRMVVDEHRGLRANLTLFDGVLPAGRHSLIEQLYVAPTSSRGPARMFTRTVLFDVTAGEWTHLVVSPPIAF